MACFSYLSIAWSTKLYRASRRHTQTMLLLQEGQRCIPWRSSVELSPKSRLVTQTSWNSRAFHRLGAAPLHTLPCVIRRECLPLLPRYLTRCKEFVQITLQGNRFLYNQCLGSAPGCHRIVLRCKYDAICTYMHRVSPEHVRRNVGSTSQDPICGRRRRCRERRPSAQTQELRSATTCNLPKSLSTKSHKGAFAARSSRRAKALCHRRVKLESISCRGISCAQCPTEAKARGFPEGRAAQPSEATSNPQLLWGCQVPSHQSAPKALKLASSFAPLPALLGRPGPCKKSLKTPRPQT